MHIRSASLVKRAMNTSMAIAPRRVIVTRRTPLHEDLSSLVDISGSARETIGQILYIGLFSSRVIRIGGFPRGDALHTARRARLQRICAIWSKDLERRRWRVR